MSCYISSVACLLTWSTTDLRANTADPLLGSAVEHLRKRMKRYLEASSGTMDEMFRCDTESAIQLINIVRVTTAPKNHVRTAVTAMIWMNSLIYARGVRRAPSFDRGLNEDTRSKEASRDAN